MADGSMTQARAANTGPATIRRIGFGDLREALALGWSDFLTIPTQLVFLCILYPVVGLVAARAAIGEDLVPLLFPLVAGMALLGPVLAVGVYELSRRREQGKPATWLNAFDVLRSPSIFPIAVVAVVLLVIFTVWIAVARGLYESTLGAAHPLTAGAFLHDVFATGAGWRLIVLGNFVGFLFAAAVLALTAVSVPMLLDHATTSPLEAMRTSLRAVAVNPAAMALWGLIVAVVLALGCLPLFMGLAVAMPVLGHATWHLYRKVVV